MPVLIFIFQLFFLVSVSYADLTSPFPSTLEDIQIPNSHQLDEGVFRGMSPLKYMEDLRKLQITEVLILKNQTKQEVDQEILELKKLKINYTHIPFLYHNFPSEKEACTQLVGALKLIRKVKADQGQIYFHCTVGEDRTGALAGLYNILFLEKNLQKTFQVEMCERGYERGNPFKPSKVVESIRNDLTPLFLKMAQKIELGELSLDREIWDSEKICNFTDSKFIEKVNELISSRKFLCKKAL